MNKKPYSSSIKKTPYKYPIAKKMARLLLKDMDRNEIYVKCFDDNYVEIDSIDRRREVTNVLYNRLRILDKFILNQFVAGDIATSKFILVYAIAKTDSLFFDFLFEVYREAILGEKNYLSIDDFDLFFEGKKQSDLIVSKWGTDTLKCLTKGYRNILTESGLGVRERKNIVCSKIMIHPAVIEHIKLIGDEEYIKAILGGD